jgi:hypothetical protein
VPSRCPRQPHTTQAALSWESTSGEIVPIARDERALPGRTPSGKTKTQADEEGLLHDVKIVTTVEEAKHAAAVLLRLTSCYHAIDTEVRRHHELFVRCH